MKQIAEQRGTGLSELVRIACEGEYGRTPREEKSRFPADVPTWRSRVGRARNKARTRTESGRTNAVTLFFPESEIAWGFR